MSVIRRQILAGLAGVSALGLGAGGVRYWLGRPGEMKTHDYELIAAPLNMELMLGHKTSVWADGGQVPGLELRAQQGDWLRVRFVNRVPEPSTIHWHGIRLPLEMDGVPYVSQLPVLPGEYFDYRFRLPDAGSFWYHPHTASGEQLGRGLVGPLIAEERELTGFRHERTLSLKSWHVDGQGAFGEFSVPREVARGGTPGRLTTVNGEAAPTLELPAGQIVRLRILNFDNTLTYRLTLPDAEARIYTLDGNPAAPRPLGREYWLEPGMRIELGLWVPAAGAELSLRNGSLRLAMLRSVAAANRPATGQRRCRPTRFLSPIYSRRRACTSTSSGLGLCRRAWSRAGASSSGRSTARLGTSATEAVSNGPSPPCGTAAAISSSCATPASTSIHPLARNDFQGAGPQPPEDHAVFHRHLSAGAQQRNRTGRRWWRTILGCGCSTVISSTTWKRG